MRLHANASNDIMRTWVHESLHGRQPFGASHRFEYRSWRGYEEGIVEPLTLRTLGSAIAIGGLDKRFKYYVMGWRTLTQALGLDLATLLRAHWMQAPGSVRLSFADVMNHLLALSGRQPLHRERQRSLLSVADTVFATSRAAYTGNELLLRRVWEGALK